MIILRKVFIVLIVIVVLLTFFWGGYGLGIKTAEQNLSGVPEKSPEAADTYESGWLAAEQKLIEAGVIEDEPEEITMANGEVVDKGNDYITISAYALYYNPLREDLRTQIKVMADSNTQLILRKEKSPQELEQAQAEFDQKFNAYRETINNNPQADISPPEPPSPFTEQRIGLNDFQAGERVRVDFVSNVKGQDQGLAERIVKTENYDPLPTPEPAPAE